MLWLIGMCHFVVQSVLPQKGNEANSSLGGIDLNNSGRLDNLWIVLCPALEKNHI